MGLQSNENLVTVFYWPNMQIWVDDDEGPLSKVKKVKNWSFFAHKYTLKFL